jgi:hypothetical protein
MKNLSFLFIAFLLAAVSCSSPITEADIPGEWVVTKYSVQSETIAPALIMDAKKHAIGTAYRFDEDHNFALESELMGTKVGTWSFDAETNVLRFTSGDIESAFTLGSASNSNRMEMLKSVGKAGIEITTIEK